MDSKLLGQLLIDSDLITKDQLNDAIKKQEHDKRMIGEILIELGYIKKTTLVDCLNLQVKEYNNMIYAIMKNDYVEDTSSLVDYEFYERNKNELIFQTKKSWERIKLSTKIAIIDIQHVWLIMLSHYASMLFKTFERNSKIKEINTVLDLLISYSHEHFIVEETLLEIINIDPSHYEQHRDFIRYFRTKIENTKKLLLGSSMDANSTLNEICEYLNNWILSHIAIYDTSYAIKVTQSKNREEILNAWIKKMKDNKLAVISLKQKELYDSIIK